MAGIAVHLTLNRWAVIARLHGTLLQDNPVLLLPWLFMGLLVIFLETFLFASRLFYEGIHMNRSELLFTGECAEDAVICQVCDLRIAVPTILTQCCVLFL